MDLRVTPKTAWLCSLVPALALLLSSPGCRQDAKVVKQRYLESGDRYSKSGKYAEAIIEYKNALQQDSRDGDVHAKLAEASFSNGDLGYALGEYARAADLLPDDVSLQLKSGRLLLLAGRFDDAKARAEKILEKDHRSVDAQVLLANALSGLKDVDGAVAQIEDALRVDPERSGTYSNLGALELSRGKRDTAEVAFKKAVALAPRSVQAHLSLANFYWLTGQFTHAEDSLKHALDLDPGNVLSNRALANFYLATRRPADAEQPLKTVAEVTKSPAAALMLADYYVAAGNDSAARITLRPLLNEPRSSNEAAVRLAVLDYKGGQRDDAYRGVENVLKKDQANLQGLLLKASLLLADQKLDEALQIATTATVRHTDSSRAFFQLGRVQVARRQPDAASAAFQEVLRLNPRATEAKIALAQLNLSQGRAVDSLVFAQEALIDSPSDADARFALVRGLLARGELDRAEPELKGLLARFPTSSAVHTQMGILLTQKRDLAAAQAEFEHAMELNPADVEALSGQVALDLRKRDFKSAQSRVDSRIAAKPTANLLVLGARVHAASNDMGTVEKYLRQAIELDSGNLAAYAGLGGLYLSQKKLDQARTEFEAVAARQPKSIAAWTMVGIILQAQGDAKGARERFERIIEIDPEAAVAANNLAWTYAETGGNLDVALQLAQTAHKHLPDVAAVNDTLGFVYYKKDLAALAIPPLKASTQKEPGNPLYQYHLGLAYVSSGDTTSARKSLARAIALKSDFDGAQQARTLLTSLTSR
jgi:putative PEP-CTERM system TPR-repeat lipoprotein